MQRKRKVKKKTKGWYKKIIKIVVFSVRIGRLESLSTYRKKENLNKINGTKGEYFSIVIVESHILSFLVCACRYFTKCQTYIFTILPTTEHIIKLVNKKKLHIFTTMRKTHFFTPSPILKVFKADFLKC